MNLTLHTILLIYSAVIGVNIVTSSVLWYTHRHILFLYLTLVWIFSGLNFFLQGVFLDLDLGMLLSFSTYVLVSLTLYRLTQLLLKIPRREKIVYILPALFIFTGCLVIGFARNYLIASAFAAFAIALPMLRAAWLANRTSESRGFRVLTVLLTLNALHFLDYPFLRTSETGAVFGFSFALLLTFSFSIFFPSFLLLQIANEYTSRLETEVQERTKVLVDLDNRNKTLISILVHDLSTPMTSALLKIQKTRKEVPTHTEALSRIEQILKSISSTIEKVRELQAVTLGKRTLHLQSVDPLACIREAIANFQEELSLKRMTAEIKDERIHTESINADPQLLRNQVLSNFLSNAIKFSKDESALVFRVRDDNESVTIEVIDFGPGISKEKQKHIFSFTNPTSSLGNRKEQGTGFGLPLAHSCVLLMKGTLEIKSQYQDSEFLAPVGTNFQIKFQKSLSPSHVPH